MEYLQEIRSGRRNEQNNTESKARLYKRGVHQSQEKGISIPGESTQQKQLIR